MKTKITCIICLFLLCALNLQAQEDFGMRMHVINVGQAEAILLEFQHHAILVDAGGEETKDADRYQRYLANYLQKFFKDRDYLKNTLYGVVVSHPHIDHVRYLNDVIEKYNVETFIEGGGNSSRKEVKDILMETRELIKKDKKTHIVLTYKDLKGSQITDWADKLMEKSKAKITFLSGRRFCYNENNDSLAMRIEFGQKSFLLTGDSEKDDEDKAGNKNCGGLIWYLYKQYGDSDLLNVDVYKAGHHGSHNGTENFLLKKVSPDYSVISAGKYEDREPGGFHAYNHGHPRGNASNKNMDAVLKIIKFTAKNRDPINAYYLDESTDDNKDTFTLSKAVYCTCWDDNVIFTVNKAGDNISVETKKSQ